MSAQAHVEQGVEFCGLRLAHRLINGSGTFDAIAAGRVFGEQRLREAFPFSAYVSKTITLQPREGNPPPRLWEASAGLVNSIGLPNKGLEGYLREDLPRLAELSVPLITNVMGATAEELGRLAEACDARSEIAAIELNVSCPNVSTGLDIGSDPRQLEQVVREVRGLGLLVGVELTHEGYGGWIIPEMLKAGVTAAWTLNQQRVIRLEPPLVVSESEIERALQALRGGVATALAKLGPL